MTRPVRLSALEHDQVARCLRIIVDSGERITTGNLSHERAGIVTYAELAQRTLAEADRRAAARRARARKAGRRRRRGAR